MTNRVNGLTYPLPAELSENERAARVCGLRADGIAIDLPCELGYHCPVCEYAHETNGEWDERLDWSEYRFFIWCRVCNVDYPSVICQPDPVLATEIFLTVLEEVKS